MASATQNLTTYYAKRIIGDTAAASETSALLQTGTGVDTNTWILHRTNRNKLYGIKYLYDNSSGGKADKIELYGDDKTTAWVELDTGDVYIMGKVGIGYNPNTTGNTYKLYVNGSSYFNGYLIINQPDDHRDNGIYGTYKYTKAATIWSMGTAYKIAADGSGLGSLYGAAYGYAGQEYLGSNTYAGGHQFLWCENGTVKVALGQNIWTAGKVTATGGYADRTNGTATYLNYGAAGLAASAITWLTCWNGYELRAISKAEMANAVDGSHKWVRLGGDTMTGVLTTSYKSGTWVNSLTSSAITLSDTAGSYGGWICGPTKNGRIAISTYQNSDDLLYIGYGERGRTTNSFTRSMTWNGANGRLTTASVANAIWNDYAECRVADTIEPGYCITETQSGKMTKTNKRLMPGCKLISDTYGVIMGETSLAQTPIAVAGRVLAYTYRDRNDYPLGAAVCSAPNGTVDIMTRDEIMMYPERIIGTVSEIPDYEIWKAGEQGEKEIQVNNRIWIYVK